MPNVLIFKETLLPPSETFILAQMGALRRFSPYLVGLELVKRGLPWTNRRCCCRVTRPQLPTLGPRCTEGQVLPPCSIVGYATCDRN